MGLSLLKRKFDTITEGMAKHFLNYNDYDTQRAIRLGHVEELTNKILNGKFRSADICFASLNGKKERMMNGQHTCHAIVAAKTAVEGVIDHYHCDTLSDMSDLFMQFENLPRSIMDCLRQEREALGIKWPMWVTNLVLVGASIDFLARKDYLASGVSMGNVTYKHLSKKHLAREKKIKLLGNYIIEGNFINNILKGTNTTKLKEVRHIAKGAVVFLMIETMKVSIANAHEFWINVRDGENLTKNMAELKYRDFLLKAATSKKMRGMALSNHEYVYRGHLAWNSYRRGRITNLAYRVAELPAKLI